MRELINQSIHPIILAGLLFGSILSGQSHATTVSVDPLSTSVDLHSNFSVLLKGTDFTNITGFGIDLKWDSTLITLVSAVVDGTPWEFTTSNIGNNAHQINTGTANGIGGSSFASRSGNVELVQLNFQSLGKTGMTALDLSVSANPVWLWADTAGVISPVLNNGNISVVPVPAAVWLMLTGIASLGALGRRRKSVQ